MSGPGAFLKSNWKQLLLLAGVALLFVGAEKLLKLYYYGRDYSHYDVGGTYWEDSKTALLMLPDRHLFWRYKPNIAIKLDTPIEEYSLYQVGTRTVPNFIELETNSRGWREREFSCRKPEGVFRVFSLGDSRTMAEGVVVGERYSDRLERQLNARGDGVRYEVLNAATDGYSSYQGRTRLAREILECEPDMVTALFGINDQDWDQNIRDVDKAVLFDTPMMTFNQLANRSMLVYFMRSTGRRVRGALFGKQERIPTVLTESAGRTRRVTVEDFSDNLQAIADMGREDDFIPVFIIVPNSPYSFYPELYDTPEDVDPDVERIFDRIPLLTASGKHEQAVELLEGLVEQYPDLSNARFALAQIYQQLERWDDAHREFVHHNDTIIFRHYEAASRQVAANNPHVLLVDLVPEFNEMRREPLYVDDMHPGSLGQEVIADGIMSRLGNKLAKP